MERDHETRQAGASWARLGAGVALALAGFAAVCPASTDVALQWTTVHDTAISPPAQARDGAPLTVEVRCTQGRVEVRLRHPRLGEIAREREDRRPGWLDTVRVTIGWDLDAGNPQHHGAITYWYGCKGETGCLVAREPEYIVERLRKSWSAFVRAELPDRTLEADLRLVGSGAAIDRACATASSAAGVPGAGRHSHALLRVPANRPYWQLYDHPAPRHGRPVTSAGPDTRWTVLGCYRSSTPLAGEQRWVGVPGRVWVQTLERPEGRTEYWTRVPRWWIRGDLGPCVDPGWAPAAVRPVPVAVRGCRTVAGGPVRSAPASDAPILVEAVDGETDQAPIIETQGGWHRIEHRQRQGWIRARDARVSSCAPWWSWWKEGWVRTCLTFGGTWRLCTAREDGRLAEAFQRRYDRMDPVCGREPGHPQAPQGTCP